MKPTQRQLDMLRTYLALSSMKEAAAVEGVTLQTTKNGLKACYRALGVHSAIEAAAVLGWLTLPARSRRCAAMAGRCVLPPGHYGRHFGQIQTRAA